MSSRLNRLSAEERALLVQRLQEKRRSDGRLPSDAKARSIPRRPPEMVRPPLSFSQQRLWFIDRLRPGDTAYNIPYALSIRGPFDPAALARALNTVVARHEALRTTFAVEDEDPVQVIAPHLEILLPLIDLSGLEAGAEAEQRRLADEEAQVPFDLQAGPLLRVHLLRLAPRHHRILLTMHHIISDGWSMGVLTRELMTLYMGFSQGLEPVLPPLPIQFADYTVWQRELLSGERLESHLSYWRRQLAGLPEVLPLPHDRAPQALQNASSFVQQFWIDEATTRGLRNLAREEQSTLFIVLLAAFQTLLGRWTAQDDLAVGSPVANRNHREVADLVGFFVNTLVLRGDLSGDPPFRELVRRARRVSLDALAHQELPFERLVEELRPERHADHTPLFQVLFALQNTPMPEGGGGDLLIEFEDAGLGNADLDLSVGLQEIGDRVLGDLQIASRRFFATTGRRLAAFFGNLLAAAAANPELRLSELPLLGAAERAQLLREWNDAPAAPWREDLPLHRLIEARAAAAPDAPALLSAAGESLTYGELVERAGGLARRLRALGVGAESRVALLADRSPSLVVGLLAVLQAGGCYLPLDPSHPAERISLMLEDAEARVVLTRSEVRQRMAWSPGPEVRIVDLDDPGIPEAGEPLPEVDPASAAYIIYTSGSSGRPKGVVVSHRSVTWYIRTVEELFRLGPTDRGLQFSSVTFDSSVEEIWGPLVAGALLVLRSEEMSESVSLFLREAGRLGVTVLTLPTAFWHELAAGFEETGEELPPTLRLVIFGGEEAQPHRITAWQRRGGGRLRLLNGYGPTETTIACTFQDVTAWRAGDEVPIGRALSGARAYVADPDLRLMPIGAWGELLVGGGGVARGYLERPDLTAERFVPDPWSGTPGARLYRTGDRVRFRADGALLFGGRVDQQVKVRGYRVEPGEIEAALATHPAVREVVVVARRIAGQGSLLAAVVRREGATADGADLRRFLAERLPAHMVPSAVVLLPELPLTPNGKVDRRALARLEPAAERGPSVTPSAPRTPVEEVLAGLWAEVLGVARVGADESFFDLGGHSLSATRLVSRLRGALGVELPLRALFEAPTVRGLAERFVEPALRSTREEGAPAPPPLRPRRAGEPAALSFGQERLWFLDRLEPGTTTLNMGSSLRLRGRLHVAALEGALDEIVRRHETLRSTFREEGGHPVVRVADDLRVGLPLVDLSGLPEPAREAEAGRVARAELSVSFDLETGPLLRVRLLRLEPELHALLLDVHHIVSDGWSMAVLDRELVELYAAFAEGRPSPLPELPVQYGDFARWQRDWLRGEVLEAQLAWWRRSLGSNPPPLDLPTDRPRPAVQTFRGASLPLRLPDTLGGELRALSRREGASLFMTLLAGFQALLHRWSGQDEIVAGSPIAGRRQIETEGLIGFFLNTLALRTDLSGNPSFRELLGRVREVTLGAYAHQDIPFEALLADLQPERDLSRTPLFQVFFNMLNLPAETAQLPGSLEVEAGEAPVPPSKFDLTFYVAEDGDGIQVNLVYNADLFDPPRMEELLAQYTLLLEQAAARPEAPVREHALVTARAAQVLPDPTASLGDEWFGAVHELFAERARRHPERPAVTDAEGTWTYGELAAAAARLAAWLRERGLERGERVAVWAHRSAPVAWAVLGVLEAGGAFVLLDPAYPPARIVEILRLAAPRAWVALEAAGEPAGEISALLEELPLRGRLSLPGGGPGGGPAGAAALLESLPAPAPAVSIGPDDIAYVAFTSGSTGMPKGILGRHGPLSHFLPWHWRYFGLDETDRYTLLSGLAHDPLLRDLFTSLCSGATLCVPAADDLAVPGRLAEWAARQGITVTHLTPAMALLLTEVPRDGREPVRLPALRWALLVGEALTRLDVDRLRRLAPGVTCVNLYGATETQRALAHHVVRGDGAAWERARQVLPLGRGLSDLQLLVLNAAGSLAGIGEVGEIWMRTPHLAAGYLDDEPLTRERFRVNPFTGREGDRVYRTGDLGRYLLDGDAAFAGRADQQVKIRGFRIEPAEIQAAIGRQPGVRDSVVVAREDGGERYLAAYVVRDLATGTDPLAGLRSALASQLPDYMVPAVFVEIPALPLTPNGKLDRRALPVPDRRRSGEMAAPRTPAEEALVEIWAEVLRRDRVGVHDDFFELGGHSLLAALVAARVREALGVELPLRALFEARTVAGLAARIEEAWHAREPGLPSPPPLLPVERSASGETELPLSFSQERLWFLDRLDPGSPAYNMPVAVRLRGRLDVPALTAALADIVRRHEALRTTFRETGDGSAVQVVHPAAPLPLPGVDLSGLPPASGETEARRLAAEHARRPFDLERGPLARACLLRLGAEEHAVLWVTHHILSDGWSVSAVFVPELAALYEAFSQGRPSPLPALPVQFGDWAAWQRSWLRGEALEAQLAWWRAHLADAPTALELPTDRPRRVLRAVRGGTRPWSLSPEETRRLHAFAREGGATLFMVLHAALSAVLGRWTGQRDVLLGTPVANRSRTEIEGVIGFFVNTLVLRGDLSGHPGMRALVARSRDAALGAYAHQDLPFERLVEDLQPDRDLSRSPLFQVMLVLQNAPAEGMDMPGLRLEPLPVEGGSARFELTLSLAEGPAGLSGAFDYDAGLFDAATIDRLGEHLTALLRGGVSAPERPVGLLPMLSEAERSQVWEMGTGVMAPERVVPVERLILEQAARAPEAVAIAFEDRRVTYGELRASAEDLARRLRVVGVGPEVRVGVALERCPELIVAFLGVLLAGGAYVPIDPGYPAERVEMLVEDARLAAVVVEEESFPLPGGVCVPRVRSFVCAPEALPVAPAGHAHPAGDPPLELGGELAAYVIYTSGSTGRPKGVVVSRGALGSYALAMARVVGMRASDRMLMFLSPSFDAAGEAVYPTLVSGGTLVLHRRPNALTAGELAAVYREHEVTVLELPGLVLRQWLAEGVEVRPRVVMTGGESPPVEMMRGVARWLPEDGTFISCYGPTEATVTTTVSVLGAREAMGFEGAVVPLGRPLDNTAVRLMDREMELVPLGVAGEVCIAGAGLARGYLGRPDLTAAAFVPDPFDEPGARVYRTGDLARRRADGTLEFLGRVDDQVKVRGFRVELGEIEAALAAHPAVREVAVIARAERGKEKRLVAFVVPEGDAPGVAELRGWLAHRLPEFMVPSAIAFLDALPVTTTDKIDRRALAERDPGAALESGSVAPRDLLELRLARLWEEVLDVRPVGVRDDFFALGGHSLLTVRLAALVRSRFGVELPLASLFQAPTVERMAALLRAQGDPAGRPPRVEIQTGAPGRRPLFLVHPIGGNVLAYTELARRLGPDLPVHGLQTPDEPPASIEGMADLYLQAVREAQPEGPYRLAGWSMGGLVAWEMARRLTARGEKVELLALIDTASPGVAEPEAGDATLAAWFAADLAHTLGYEPPADLDLGAEDAEEVLARALAVAREAEVLPPGLEIEDLRRLFALYRVNYRAMAAYEPGPYSGPVRLLHAASRNGHGDPTLGWSALAAGGLDVEAIPGDHYSILRGEGAAALAAWLAEALE